VVLPVTIPYLSICPNWIVKPFAESISLTPANVGMFANCCKFAVSSLSPSGPAVIPFGGPLNLTI